MGDHVGILSVVLFLPALFSFIFFPLIFKNQHPGSFGVEVRVDRAIASSIVLYLAS